MRRGQRVPLPAPPEDRGGGDVRQVRDRAVGVAALDRGLAAAVRLDALAHLPLGVLRPTRLEAAALRHVPVRRLSVEDAVGADDTGQPDVDHPARCLDVEADPEPEEKDCTRREHPGRPHGAKREPASSQADPETAREQVQENRVHERDAEEDLAAVVEGQRDGQPEQHEEIEVHAPRAGVGDPRVRGRTRRRTPATRRASTASSRRTRPPARAPSARRPAARSAPPSHGSSGLPARRARSDRLHPTRP